MSRLESKHFGKLEINNTADIKELPVTQDFTRVLNFGIL